MIAPGPIDRSGSVRTELLASADAGRSSWVAAAIEAVRRRLRGPLRRIPATAADARVYAIGDVHGRIDLLRDLLIAIEQDNAGRPPRQVMTVLLGDMIDRGAGAAALLSALARERPAGLVCLLGNHEAALIDAYDGHYEALDMWLAHGGQETLVGFGADPAAVSEAHGAAMLALVHSHVPADCIAWLRTLPLHYGNGDYFFTHAGIRPGRRLSRQRRDDLLWIREEFLHDARWHGKVVVHGHTPSEDVQIRSNRIGVDTGAFATGILSAVGLQDDQLWVLQARRDG